MKENKLNIITELLVSELKPKRLILFGSRAKGTSLPNSDFDIAVEVKRIDFRRKRIIKEKIRKVRDVIRGNLEKLSALTQCHVL